MKKLTLDLDALAVDSFATASPAARDDGTVHAHAATGTGCAVTSGINSCWCTEFRTCDCV